IRFSNSESSGAAFPEFAPAQEAAERKGVNMSTVLQPKPASSAADNLAEKLGFQQKLQAVTNKIHATKNIDEIILELSQELCNLFNADRLTIYLLSEDKGSIISKVKTGL